MSQLGVSGQGGTLTTLISEYSYSYPYSYSYCHIIAYLYPVCGEGRLQGLELAMTVSLAATPTNLSLLAPSPASSRRSSSGGSHVSRVSRDSR